MNQVAIVIEKGQVSRIVAEEDTSVTVIDVDAIKQGSVRVDDFSYQGVGQRAIEDFIMDYEVKEIEGT